MRRAAHGRDSDCTLDAAGVCLDCGVVHGPACWYCGGAGFHKPDCGMVEDFPGALDALTEWTADTLDTMEGDDDA